MRPAYAPAALPVGSRFTRNARNLRVDALRMSADPKNVLIVGAGPAGLLAAHHLLRRSDAGAFKITIAELRADPRASEQASLRSYSLGLGVRGQAAINKAGTDLWELVKTKGVECDKFSLHIGKRVIQIRQESPVLVTKPSVLINRADLCAALLDGFDLSGCPAPSLRFESQCVSVDTDAREVVLEGADGARESLPYDVLIGADGVNSKVRDAMIAASGSSVQFAQAPLNGTLKTIHQPMPATLDPLSVHAMGAAIPLPEDEEEEGGKASPSKPNERIGLFWVPERNRTTAGAPTMPCKRLKSINLEKRSADTCQRTARAQRPRRAL